MFQHQRPAGLLLVDLITADNVRHNRLRRAGRVVAEMSGIAARQTHVALQERRRFVQHAVRSPAIRTRENRRRTVSLTDTFVLRVDKRQRIVPAHPHKFILPARALWLIRRRQKTFTHHRPTHTRFTVHLIAYHRL
ncbi:hypothetical protein D3C76_1042590 [compost metagenome]